MVVRARGVRGARASLMAGARAGRARARGAIQRVLLSFRQRSGRANDKFVSLEGRRRGQLLYSRANRSCPATNCGNYISVREPNRASQMDGALIELITMARRVVWKIAAPMIGLGVLLLVLGAFAAYNVQEQQRISSEIVAHQVNTMLAIHELNIVMREVRYQANAFLRTGDVEHLRNVSSLHPSAETLLESAKRLALPGREQQRIQTVEQGYRTFVREFETVLAGLSTSAGVDSNDPQASSGTVAISPLATATLTRISDDEMTNQVLRPLEESLSSNRETAAETNRASQSTAQHLKIGFLLLGICGAIAGLLLGTVVARAVGRSIVQLNVTVRSVAGRLSDVARPVSFSHTGDLAQIDTGLRALEEDIGEVVERLQQRETELLRSEQLAKVGQLAAGVAHELRNPLMPMKILVQAALERDDGTGLHGRSLQVVNEEIGRLERSIQSFLDYARPPLPEKVTLDVREIVAGTLELVAGRAREQRVEIASEVPDEAVLAHVDRGQIRQLLLNLLLNALDVLPEGGTVRCVVDSSVEEIRVEHATAQDELIVPAQGFNEHDALRLLSHSSARPKRHIRKLVEIRVIDSGPGIAPAALAAVFEPFVTTKETGTGLGLSICRRIALDHEGELAVRNRPQGGAEFTFTLPKYG